MFSSIAFFCAEVTSSCLAALTALGSTISTPASSLAAAPLPALNALTTSNKLPNAKSSSTAFKRFSRGLLLSEVVVIEGIQGISSWS